MSKSPTAVWTLRLTLVGALIALLGSACVDVKVDVDRGGQKKFPGVDEPYADEDEEGLHAFDARADADDDDDDDDGDEIIHEHVDRDDGTEHSHEPPDDQYHDHGVDVEVNGGDGEEEYPH